MWCRDTFYGIKYYILLAFYSIHGTESGILFFETASLLGAIEKAKISQFLAKLTAN